VSLVCLRPSGCQSLRAANCANCDGCSGEQAKRTLPCGNPIAESLWPTIPSTTNPLLMEGPFQPWRRHERGARPEWDLPAPKLRNQTANIRRPGPRIPCYVNSANGLPVSASS
jgi:hypothetical protein